MKSNFGIQAVVAAALIILSAQTTAQATFHLMQIQQVIGGVNGDTTAQAIQLRFRSAGQHLVSPARMRAWDAAGLNPVVVVDFTTNLPVAGSATGARILIQSPNFAFYTSPSATPNYTMSNLIPASYLAAGSLTFETDGGFVYWRLSWGGASYTGPNNGAFDNDANGDYGPPYPDPLPSGSLQALLFQGAASAQSATNAADYALTAGAAVFTNYAGQSFTVSEPEPTGACCDDDTGGCFENETESDCLMSGFRYGGDGSTCETINPPCTGPTGACCDDDSAVCMDDRTESACLGDGFRYGGDESTCLDINPACTGPTGACCDELSGMCEDDVTLAECNVQESRFGGPGSTCGNIDPPCEEVRIRIVLEPVGIGGALARADGTVATSGTPLASPVHVTHAGDNSGRLFVVDQIGTIRIIDPNDELLPTPFLDISAKLPTLGTQFDERGLLGLVFHPDYHHNGRFYVRYSAPRSSTGSEPCDSGFNAGCHKEVLAEYLVLGDPETSNVADPVSERILFEVDEPQFNHNAGSVEFGPDGYLYFSLGDGGGAHDGLADMPPSHGPDGNGQNIETALGSLLRIDVDSPAPMGAEYVVPEDNPFATECPMGFPDCVPEIYAYGLRNPYRFSFDDGPGGDGSLYLADVGQALYEEVNIVELGGNYGWVIREGFECFDPFDPGNPPISCDTTGPLGEPLLDPVSVYTHAEGGTAILGGYVYRGSRFDALSGKYVYGDFSADFGPTGRLYYFSTVGPSAYERKQFLLSPEDEPLGLFLKGLGRDEEGEIYACASSDLAPSGSSGVVFRITAPPARPGPEPGGADKARFFSLTVPESEGVRALRVQLTSLHHPPDPPAGTPDFSGLEGEYRFVNAFRDQDENPVFDCSELLGPYKCARLGCDPEFHDWDAILGGEVLHITGNAVAPSSIYSAVALAASCAGSELTCNAVSDELNLGTGLWGDVTGVGNMPDGFANVLDVSAIVDKIKDLPAALSTTQVWLKDTHPNPAQAQINVLDLSNAVEVVRGFPYPFPIISCN